MYRADELAAVDGIGWYISDDQQEDKVTSESELERIAIADTGH